MLQARTAIWAAIIGTACAAAETVAPDLDVRDAPPTTIMLGAGETRVFHGVEISFVSVPEDSRCPSDVVCVHAGNAIAEIGVGPTRGLGPVHQLLLNTNREPREGTGWDLRVRLVQLLPYPVSKRVTPQQEYVAELLVEGTGR